MPQCPSSCILPPLSLLFPLSLPIPPSHPFLPLLLSLWVSLKGQVTLGHWTQPLPLSYKALALKIPPMPRRTDSGQDPLQCRTDLPGFMHSLTNYFKKKRPIWSAMRRNFFFLHLLFPFFFKQHLLLPSLAPRGPVLPQMLALAWGRGFRYLIPLESVVWQMRIETHSSQPGLHWGLRENTWVPPHTKDENQASWLQKPALSTFPCLALCSAAPCSLETEMN